MAGLAEVLSIFRGVPEQQLLCIFNPVSGAGEATRVAEEISEFSRSRFRGGENRYDVSLLPTVPNRSENIARIGEQLEALRRADRPLKVLSIGGDGTLDLVVSGYLTFLFGNLAVLSELDPKAVSSRLRDCPIQLGVVPMGSANDIGGLYKAPKPRPKAVAHYLAKSVDANLHLGMAVVQQEDRQEIWPFVHSFAAGHVFTPVLVDSMAGGRRGREAMAWMLRNGVGRIFGKAERRILHWRRSDGTVGEMPAQDSMAHALPRLAIAVGLPGLQPFESIGFKTVPETGLAARLLIGAELFGSGLLSRMGRMVPLSASARLATVPESHQKMLNVGEWIEFEYTDPEGQAAKIGYQVSGDGIGYTRGPIRIHALPAIEHFMMMQGAPIARLLMKNVLEGGV